LLRGAGAASGAPAPPVLLSREQIDFFETFGYLALPGALADDIAWVQHEFEAVWAARPDLVHDGSKRCVCAFVCVCLCVRVSE
jgi:hypothetical protein